MSHNKAYNKKDFSQANLEDTVQKIIDRGIEPGLFCTDIVEDVPTFRQAQCEKVIKNSYNSSIVLGRDRNESRASGAGGKGYTQCGMIDIVVGRGATYSAKKRKQLTPKDVIGPSFSSDAARIYITQKSLGIDSYFGFANTKTDSFGKSAVALKADHTRIIARESVRIYCGAGAFTQKETNSNGASLEVPKIELIAGNEDKLQPVVLGDNLVEHLSNNQDMMRDMLSALVTIFSQLAQINGLMSVLTLGTGGNFINNLIDDVDGLVEQSMQIINTWLEETSALDKCLLPGNRSILSNTVYTT